ncbi:hypothetical protein P4O66_012814, partial [Electrophorus voltai]
PEKLFLSSAWLKADLVTWTGRAGGAIWGLQTDDWAQGLCPLC